MQRQWLDWVDRQRIVVISALNSTVIVTFAVLIAVVTSDSDSKEAHALAEPANATVQQAAEETTSRGARQPRRSAIRRTPHDNTDQPSAGDAPETGQLRGSSFRIPNSPPRRTRAAPCHRDVASHQNVRRAQQQEPTAGLRHRDCVARRDADGCRR